MKKGRPSAPACSLRLVKPALVQRHRIQIVFTGQEIGRIPVPGQCQLFTIRARHLIEHLTAAGLIAHLLRQILHPYRADIDDLLFRSQVEPLHRNFRIHMFTLY